MRNNELLKTTNNIDSEDNQFFRYAMVVEYNGSLYAGSQKQPKQKTVQSELESAVSVLTKQEIKVIFSGRTDTGVHAKGQVVHFDLPYQLNTYRFMNSLNAILPSDISVSIIKELNRDFHSQKSATARWYRYTINNKPQRSVWQKEALNIRQELNINEINKALSFLLGNHDFSSFKTTNSSNPVTDCTVIYAECSSEAGVIYIDIIANRFLYNMVRIIVGTLINIGKGIFPAEYMLEVLNAKDRTKAGPTARPEGLTLMSVYYEKKYNLSDYFNMETIYNENIFSKAS